MTDTPDLKALLPCPFCGGEAIDWYVEAYSLDSSYEMFGCKSCGVGFDTGRDAENVAAWNTRAGQLFTAADVEAAVVNARKSALQEAHDLIGLTHVPIGKTSAIWNAQKDIMKLIALGAIHARGEQS